MGSVRPYCNVYKSKPHSVVSCPTCDLIKSSGTCGGSVLGGIVDGFAGRYRAGGPFVTNHGNRERIRLKRSTKADTPEAAENTRNYFNFFSVLYCS
jgi:hypothetical protein